MQQAGIEKVIGTCSTETKEDFLKSIGTNDVINFSKLRDSEQTFDDTIKNLCPSGINIAYESIGGEVLDTVIDNIGNLSHILNSKILNGKSPMVDNSLKIRSHS